MRSHAASAAAAFALLASTLLLGACATGDGPYDAELRQTLEQARARAEARTRAEEGQAERRSAVDWLAEGDAARAAGDDSQALLRYLRAHERDPDDPRPMLRIGSLHLTREPLRAERIFRELAATPESPAVAHLGLGLALLAQSRFEAAERALARAEKLAPRLVAAPAARGVALDRLGRPAQAQESYWRALSRHPDDPVILNNLGVSYLSTRDAARAAEALGRAAKLAPDDPMVQNNFGLALAGIGRYDEALEAFLRAGGPQAAHNNLATARLLKGDFEGAVAEYERALLAPGDERLAVLRNLREARRALRADRREPRGPAPPTDPATAPAEPPHAPQDEAAAAPRETSAEPEAPVALRETTPPGGAVREAPAPAPAEAESPSQSSEAPSASPVPGEVASAPSPSEVSAAEGASAGDPSPRASSGTTMR